MDILKEISKLQESYDSTITIMDGLTHSQKDVINQVEYYTNSKYLNGMLDEFGRHKPFYNIVNFRVNTATKATDLDTKDIQVYSSEQKNRIKSMLFGKEIKNWMRKNYFSKTLNTINFTRIKYGGVLVKRVFVNNDITLQVPEWKNLITDQVDIKNGFKIEKHYLTPIDIQNKEDVWEGIAENKDLIEKIIKSNDKDNNRICILEVEAQFPDNVIDGESEKYTLQKHIILTDKEEQPVAVLHQERLKTSQYKYISWLEASGRGLGIGIVEEGFEAQIATNDVVMKEGDIRELATKVLVITDSDVMEDNVMRESQMGDIYKLGKGDQFTRVDLTPNILPELSNTMKSWDDQYSRSSSTFEAVTGETMPSGTPFRSIAIQNQEARSMFDYRKEEFGIFLNEIFTDWIIPHIRKNLNREHILSSDFNDEELIEIDEAFASETISERIWQSALAGNPMTQEEFDTLFDVEKKALSKTLKKRRHIEIPKDYFKDVEFELDIITTGEQVNKQATFETLANMLQFIQDPNKRNKVMGKIVELSGVGISPSVFDAPEAPQQPPQQGNTPTGSPVSKGLVPTDQQPLA